MSSRELILGRLRAVLQRDAGNAAVARRAMADALGSAWHAEEARAVALRWQLELGRVPAAR